MVGGFLAFLEDIGHAEGVAHLNEPVAEGCGEAVVDAVEAARFPRGDILLLVLFHLHFHHLIASDAESDLRPDTQARYPRFILVVFVPTAQVDIEQQRNVDVVRLLHVTDGAVVVIQAFLHVGALARIDDVDFGTEDRTLGDEGETQPAREVGAETCAVVTADAHGAEGRTEHQAAAETLGTKRTGSQKQEYEKGEKSFVFHYQCVDAAKIH